MGKGLLQPIDKGLAPYTNNLKERFTEMILFGLTEIKESKESLSCESGQSATIFG